MPRPSFTPTDELRGMVKSMAAVGIPHENIARKVGVRSPKTLRKHFRNELELGVTEANYKVASTLFQMATSGDHAVATLFWMKSRAGWGRPAFEPASGPPPPFVVAQDRGGLQ